jgi:hypothetical protein
MTTVLRSYRDARDRRVRRTGLHGRGERLIEVPDTDPTAWPVSMALDRGPMMPRASAERLRAAGIEA